jgi:hypothetical protein
VRQETTWRADLGGGVTLTFADTPLERASGIASRSAAPGCHAEATARAGRLGLDVETLARVALDTAVDDPWLTPEERRIVAATADPLLDLACRWVLKEAYGKALGIGLALPFERIAVRGTDGRIALDGAGSGWRFALYRHGDALFGLAHQPMPFAPIGRNPPAPAPDR